MANIVAAVMMMAATPDRAQELVDRVRDCSVAATQELRATCYDQAVPALLAALKEHDVAIVDRETVRGTQRSLFGFTVPDLSIFGLRKSDSRPDDDVKELHGVARIVRETAPDHFEVRLEDGAVWRNVDAFRRPPQAGDAITIVKAALGSFFMTVGNGRIGTRCARVR